MFGDVGYPWLELMVGGLVASCNLALTLATLIVVMRAERAQLKEQQPQNGLLTRVMELEYLRGKSEGWESARKQFQEIHPPAAGGNG